MAAELFAIDEPLSSLMFRQRKVDLAQHLSEQANHWMMKIVLKTLMIPFRTLKVKMNIKKTLGDNL
jgi:hypothetical protein